MPEKQFLKQEGIKGSGIHSIIFKYAFILGLIFLLIAAFLSLGFYYTGQLRGDANIIDYMGRCRMKSFKLAAFINRSYIEEEPTRAELRQQILEDMKTLERQFVALTYGDAELGIPRPPEYAEPDWRNPWWNLNRHIEDYHGNIKPLILSLLDVTAQEDKKELLSTYNKKVQTFVHDLDRTVHLMARHSEKELSMFKTILWGLLGASVAVLVFSGLMLTFYIVEPIRKVVGGLEAFAAGERARRIDLRGRSEIGRLAESFNMMAEEIVKETGELEDINKKLKEVAIKDGLTGLYNHRHFHELLNLEYSRAIRYGLPLSLVILDIDNFKKLNDTLGHLFGDSVLAELSTKMKDSLRVTDIPARYGGEEFSVILPNTGLQGALHVAERLRRAISCHVFSRDTASTQITISLGLSSLEEGGVAGAEVLLDRADIALLEAKRRGKNQTLCWSETNKP